MMKIEIDELDAALKKDFIEGYEAFWFASEEEDAQPCDGYQVVFSARDRRGGVIEIGRAGSNGHASWTDASSPEEVVARFLSDDMRI